MNTTSYGNLCSLFYDATKTYASDQEVDFYAQFMHKEYGRILEAMSGSGRLLIPLVSRGYVVDGVDNSVVMIKRCKKRCQQLNIYPRLYEQSLQFFTSQQTYTTVTIAVGSFQLITDHKEALKALKNIHDHMIEGGNLLIDTFIPDQKNMRSEKAVRIDDQTILTLTTEYVYNEQEKRADAYCAYELFIDGNLLKTEKELIQVTWYSDQECKELLNQAGFDIITLYEKSFPTTGPSHIIHAIKRLA